MNVCTKPIKPYYEWGNLKLGSKLVPIDYMNCNIMLLQLQIQQELYSFPNTYLYLLEIIYNTGALILIYHV